VTAVVGSIEFHQRVRMAARTDPGARKGNEDHHAHGHGVNGHYAVLADGAGGHSRGREASLMAVQCLERVLLDPGVAFSPGNLTQMVRLAHAELLAQQTSDRPEARMHTTLVALWIDPAAQHVLWTHVGDSRLYRVRQGRCEALTQDDSVVQQMVLAGVLTPEQSRNHPQKNHLLAALGIEGEIEPHTVARKIELMEGDAFLLCSDGWWDCFEPEDIAASLVRAISADDWLADMHRDIKARAAPRQDNFTAIAVWVGNPGEVTLMRSDDTVPRGLAAALRAPPV
jgi:PPM family protein phosphatase